MNPRHGCIVALGIALLWSSAAGAANYVILFTARGAFSGNPSEQFVMDMEVVLDDIDPNDVSGVGVEVDNGLTSLTLERFFEGSTEWEAEVEYADFNSMKAALDGTWTITISGTAASTSTFTLDTATSMPELQESDYFPVPTNLMPAEGAMDVTLDTNFSWTDPTGGATPDLVEVEVGTEFSFSEQSNSFPFDTLLVDDESWDPPLTLFPGQSFFFVFYADVDATRLTQLTTTSGTITWGLPPEAAFFSYPAKTPVVLYGSFSEIQFDTERLLEDFEAYAQPQEDVAGPDFLITTTGNPLTDPAVAAVAAEGLAERAGIELDATNKVAFAGSGSGTTDIDGFLLIADIPALGVNLAGPFADFFANPVGTGREFFDVTVRAVVRETTGAAETQVRLLIADGADNEAATNLMPLTTAFDTFEARSFDFFDLDPFFPTDFSQITGVGIEFFAQTPGDVPQLRFQIDDVEITAAPEPSSSALGLSALTALALLARVRGRRGVGKP